MIWIVLLVIGVVLAILVVGEEHLLEPLVDWLYGRRSEKWRLENDAAKVLGQLAEVSNDVVAAEPGKPPSGKVFLRGEIWSAVPRDAATCHRAGGLNCGVRRERPMPRAIRLLLLAAVVLGVSTVPAAAQPVLHPSLGHGEVYPGTLLHSGELTLGAVDLRLAGRAADFLFARTYRNQTIGFGALGAGWMHFWEQSLRVLSNGDVDYFDGRGLRHRFRRQSDRTLRSPPGVFLALEPNSTGWALIAPDGTTTRFDTWGRLVSLSDPAHANGYGDNVIRFTHDAHDRLVEILDTHGRRFRLSYDEQGLLTVVRDPGGREVRYGYDTEGRLVTVTRPTGAIWRYAYAQPPRSNRTAYLNERDNLTSITDGLGQKVLEVVYGPDSQGHADAVVEQRWGGGWRASPTTSPPAPRRSPTAAGRCMPTSTTPRPADALRRPRGCSVAVGLRAARGPADAAHPTVWRGCRARVAEPGWAPPP
ncbi:MAG: hypothetical protein HC897_16485, partial [Thermoanaerobaculia bacterium]|nr:hypothetical protein [Thermoanaerobaculia bacterium]